MTNFPMISPLSDTELDAVTGGCLVGAYQNAKGHDMIVLSQGGNGGNATAGTGAATGGAGGVSTAAAGGAGGTNTVTGPL